MKEIKYDKTRGGHSLIKPLGITVLAILMLVGIAGAAPYAYITNDNDNHGTVTIIDTATDTVVKTVDVGLAAFGVAVNPAGTKAYVGNWGSDTVSVIDTETNTVIDTVSNVGSQAWGVAVNPEGTKVYVANTGSGTVSVIDATTNTVTAKVPVGSYPYGVAVNPDGTKVYVANGNSKTVSVIDTETNTVTAEVSVGAFPYGVAVNPTGTRVYVTNMQDNNVYAIDTGTNTVTDIVPVDSNPWAIAFNPAGTKVYVVSNTVTSVIDTATNTVTDIVPVGGSRSGVSFTPDGKKVYVVGNGTVSVIDAATNEVITTILDAGIIPVAFGQFIVPPPTVSPVANFTSNVTLGIPPLSVQFTDLSENAVGWNWDFGDGGTSTDQNPVHTYITEGIYTVNLTASNAIGTDSKSAIITVSGENVAISFDPQIVEVRAGSSQEVQIVMDEVPDGLSGFNITVSISDSEIAEITAVSFPDWGMLPRNSTVPSGSIWIKAADLGSQVGPGDTNVLLGTITLTGKKEGTSDLNIPRTMINDDTGSLITPLVNTGTVRVIVLPAFPGYTNLPTDLDQDGLFEDINGNGMLDFDDVVAYYDNMEWIEENVPLEFFDYNENGLIDFDDVVKLYDML